MNENVKMLFDAAASDYDRQRRQLIPCFDEFYGMALSLVESADASPRILDLGSGTGLFASLLSQKYPNAHFTLMDVSENMLEGARARFGDASNVAYIAADYSNYPFTEQYDFVISSLSIHHLTHEEKKRLFRTIHRILTAGGIFVNADQVQGETAASDAYYRKRWLESIYQSGLSPEAIEAAVERRKVDINARGDEQLRWLREAGFADMDCMYKYLDFAVFFAQKAVRVP
ncbi:class I SAM-dependent methyltransferase [Paenibacillus sp. S-38]|uniref:class I SAM-dependent methyltransferase n=1 Tax=Paenibacillus sp. S-38 TaxID=3416710 RepID=UPI003CEBCDCF